MCQRLVLPIKTRDLVGVANHRDNIQFDYQCSNAIVSIKYVHVYASSVSTLSLL